MTEYWKSQARKYCEFCKCWLADNKVSLSFHENGKRHKENVQNHISQVSKKSAKDYKQKEKMDDEIKKIEAAAMAAYLKDVQNNADLTSQSINGMLSKSEASTSKPEVITAPAPVHKEPTWHEVKSDNGSYFWNTESNETTWDPPDDYLSLAQQEEKKLKKKEKAKAEEKAKKQQQKDKQTELQAHMRREQMKELRVDKGAPAERPSVDSAMGPAPRAVPYGSWTPVVEQVVEDVDLQLPKSEKPRPPPPVVVEPERVVFSERKVVSLGEGPVAFKKRKFSNPQRNARQKVDDD